MGGLIEALKEILEVVESGTRAGFFVAAALIPICIVLRWFGVIAPKEVEVDDPPMSTYTDPGVYPVSSRRPSRKEM
jgi:hypothetical protein